jgi:hypothetical protein
MNAVRHGLGIRLNLDPNYNAAVDALATTFVESNDRRELVESARLLAEACLHVQWIEAVKHLVINRALNAPEPREGSIREACAAVQHMVQRLRWLARYKGAKQRIAAGRPHKSDPEIMLTAAAWDICWTARAIAFMHRIDGPEFGHFERAAIELKKLNRYHQRALGKRKRAMRLFETALAGELAQGKT